MSNPTPIAKTPEKTDAGQMQEHLQRNSQLEELKSGSSAHHSTETAPVKVNNDTPRAPDNGSVPTLVLPDPSARPDTVYKQRYTLNEWQTVCQSILRHIFYKLSNNLTNIQKSWENMRHSSYICAQLSS